MRLIAFTLAIALSATTASAKLPRDEIAYGAAKEQTLDYVAPVKKGAPLIIFVHGGGWRRGDKAYGGDTMASHFRDRGYAFASVNYRFVPEVDVAAQAADVARAIAELRKRAGSIGFDPDRIILMGHSAGAHLTALTSTDPRYFVGAGVPMSAIKGAVLLDGAGYDVPRQMQAAGPLLGRLYRNAFGTDAGRQRGVSPALHGGAPNVAQFLIVHDAGRADAGVQARLMADALKSGGTRVEVVPVANTNHAQINRKLGEPDFAVTQAVGTFADRLLQPQK